MNDETIIAIAQVSGVRNLTFALLVVSAMHVGPAAMAAVLTYGLVMYVLTGAIAIVARVWRPA